MGTTIDILITHALNYVVVTVKKKIINVMFHNSTKKMCALIKNLFDYLCEQINYTNLQMTRDAQL